MAVVSIWTGREASALRASLRMTVQAFAERLGVAARTVAYWESRAATVTPQPDMQAALDTLLARSDAAVQARFRFLLDEEGVATVRGDREQTYGRLVDELQDRLGEAAAVAGLAPADRAGLTVRLTAREADRLATVITALLASGQRHTMGPVESQTSEGEGMDRRTVVRLFGSLGILAARPETAQQLLGLSEAEDAIEVGRVDADLPDDLRNVTRAYARAWGVTPASELAGLARAHLNTVTAHLEATARPALRSRLGAVAAETAALAGWLTCLQDRRGEARSMFLFARDCSRDAQDHTLHALALGSLAYLDSPVPRGAAGGSLLAVRWLEQARTLLPDEAAAAARSWVHAQLAVEYAALDDRRAFDRAIGLAEAAAQSAGDDDGPGVFSPEGILTFWGSDGVGVTKSRGLGQALLGDPGAADTIASTVEAGGSPLGEATLLLDLAAGRVRTGQIEPACRAAAQALDLLRDGGYVARVRRIRGLRAQVTHDRLPAVRELDERLAVA